MSTNNETNVHPSQPAATCMRPLAVQAAEDREPRGPRPLPFWDLRPANLWPAKGRTPNAWRPKGRPAAPIRYFPGPCALRAGPSAGPPKSALMPEIASLAMEGHSGLAIGRQLGVPRRTVDRWLGELRQQWAEKVAESPEGLGGILTARLEAVYREAMQACAARSPTSK